MSNNDLHHAAAPRAEAELARLEKTLHQDLREALSLRTVALMVGVLVLGLGFVLSYVGAFHAPSPHRVPIAVAAPAPLVGRLVNELNGLPGQPLQATRAVDGTVALAAVRDGSASAGLLVPSKGRVDSLLVATGGGAALATAVETVVGHVEASAHRTDTITDAVPSQKGDARGLSGFYLVVGWLVGGYLVAALLGIASEARPTSARRALIRLLLIAVYAIAAGFGGALVVGPLLGALTGHVLALGAVGSLLVFCAGAVTMAFQALFGVFGIGLTLLLFVILGNPSAGGAYSTSLLPPFWRAISGVIPNGAAVQAVRCIVYFGAHDVSGNVLVVAAWAIGGAAIALAVAKYRARPVAAAARMVTARTSDMATV
jgi:hypothetical protein